MLVDPPAGWARDPDHPHAAVYADRGSWPDPQRFGIGMYLGLNTYDIPHLIDRERPFDPKWAGDTLAEQVAAIVAQDNDDTPRDYGVCDTPEQVVQRWPSLVTDPRPFLILFSTVRRADQPAAAGWRWHRWGLYIGTRDPQHDYLADDTHIDVVHPFTIVQLLPHLAAASTGT